MKLLLIEDDHKIANFIVKGLREEMHTVDVAYNGEDGLYLCGMYQYDVMILDWMLPDMDGLQLIETARHSGNSTPILMLTAKGDLEDRVLGLDKGADDYMTKPFAFRELVARINALNRRKNQQQDKVYTVSNLVLNPLKREVRREDKVIDLTVKEFKLLEYLMEHKGRIVTNTMILEQIWGIQDEVQSNVVNVTMYHLRNKINRDHEEKLIDTIRGSGYRIRDE